MAGVFHLDTLMVRVAMNASPFRQQRRRVETEYEAFADRMTRIGRTLTMGITLPVTALGIASVKAAADFETSFTGVRKTVDATERQFAKLETTFRNLAKEIPASVNEINAVAEQAGQLGIETNAIAGFTRTMVDLGVSTNLSSEQASTALARLANNLQMPQDQFDELGSTIVHLGNNLATTESEIVNMSLRIAGAGQTVGMSANQVLSFSAAFSALGIKAEFGGTAISRVMIQMDRAVRGGGQALEIFARTAGVTTEQMQQMFQEDAANAIVTFIEGLNRVQTSGQNMNEVLDKLGLSAVRVSDLLRRSAASGDLLRRSLVLGNKGWAENIALTEEAEKRYATFASQTAMLRNHLNDVGIEIGRMLVPALLKMNQMLRGALELWQSMPDVLKQSSVVLAGLAAAAGPLLIVGTRLTMAYTSLVNVVASAVATGGSALAVYSAMAGVFAFWAVGIAAAAAAVYLLSRHVYESNIWIERYNRAIEESNRLNKILQNRFANSTKEIVKQAEILRGQQKEMFVNEQMELAEKNLKGIQHQIRNTTEEIKNLNTWWQFFFRHNSLSIGILESELEHLNEMEKLMVERMKTVLLSGSRTQMLAGLEDAEAQLKNATNSADTFRRAIKFLTERIEEMVPVGGILGADERMFLRQAFGMAKLEKQLEGYLEDQETWLAVIDAIKAKLSETDPERLQAQVIEDLQTEAGKMAEAFKLASETVGMTSREAQLFSLRQRMSENMGSQAVTNLLLREAEAYHKLTTEREEDHKKQQELIRSSENLTESLTESINRFRDYGATIRMTSHEAEIWRLRQEAAAHTLTREQQILLRNSIAMARYADAVDRFKKASDERDDKIEEGKRMIERYLTPLEKLRKTQAELVEMRNLGAFRTKPETFMRAWNDAFESYEEERKKIEKPIHLSITGIEAIEAGSAEALARADAWRSILAERARAARRPAPPPPRAVAALTPPTPPHLIPTGSAPTRPGAPIAGGRGGAPARPPAGSTAGGKGDREPQQRIITLLELIARNTNPEGRPTVEFSVTDLT